MPAPTIRPAADPLEDIDRQASGADAAMARLDRADLPGERSYAPGDGAMRVGPANDVYIDATRELSEQSLDPDQERLDGDRELERIVDGDPDVEMAREELAPAEVGLGADDDDPIDENER